MTTDADRRKPRVRKPPFTRERSLGAPATPVLSWTNCSNGTVTSGTLTGTAACRGEQVYMKDVVTPGFQEIVASGGIVNTPMLRVQHVLANKSGTVRYESRTTPTTNYAVYNGDYTSIVPTWGPFKLGMGDLSSSKLAEAVNAAVTESRKKILPPSSLIAVTLAEAPKTVAMIGEAAMRFAKAVQAMDRGLPAQAIMQLLGSDKRVAAIPKGKRLAAAEDLFLRRWLETRYGWAPLMYDIQGACEAYASNAKWEEVPRWTARGRATREVDTSTNFQPPTSGGLTEPITFQKRVKALYDVRAYTLYEVDFTVLPLNAWGVTSMPLSLWELVPFSFVVDWFVNVGDWIQANTPRVGIKVVAEGYVARSYLTGEREIIAETTNASWTTINLVGWTDGATMYVQERSTLLPDFTAPTIDVKVNPQRLMDALGLITQVGKTSRYRV